MKRKPKETKKQRRQREAQQARRVPLHLADEPYVEGMMAGAPSIAGTVIASDPRTTIWLEQLSYQIDAVVRRGRFKQREAYAVLQLVNDWETSSTGTFTSRVMAATSVSDMLDRVHAHMQQTLRSEGRKFEKEHAEDLGQILDAILLCKSNFMNAAKRLLLPEGQQAVDTYLYSMRMLLDAANGHIQDLEDQGREHGIQLAREVWTWVREARVFEISAPLWKGLHNAIADNFVRAADQAKVPESERIEFLRQHSLHKGFPEKLPFDYVYVGFGAGIQLEKQLAMIRIADSDRADVIGVQLLGYLICGPIQQVFEMLHVVKKDDDYFLPFAQRYDNRWPFGETLSAWLVHEVVNLINEHNTVVINHEPSRKMREAFTKQSGKGAPGFLPKPYYTVRLKHAIVDESKLEHTKESGFGRVLSHRYDRRGHERCYVERGQLPIDPKTEAKLLKYGYRFIVGRPDNEDSVRLAYRNFPPKRSDEWMAIKVRWIEDTVVGDETLPYIPAVRVPEKPQESAHAK